MAVNTCNEGKAMIKSGIDHDALVDMFSQATAKQGEALRKAVSDAMLKALQSRELTLDNIQKVLKTVTQAASSGASMNPLGASDVEPLLSKALAGMDGALLQAVEAQRKALQQFVAQGVDLNDEPMKSALAHLEKMDELFFTTVSKATQDSSSVLQAPWQHVLDTLKLKGTDTGAQAGVAVEQLLAQAQTALREGRAASMRVTQTMLDSYAALASSVLMGMTESMQSGVQPGASRSGKK
jgi:hypothetical protein